MKKLIALAILLLAPVVAEANPTIFVGAGPRIFVGAPRIFAAPGVITTGLGDQVLIANDFTPNVNFLSFGAGFSPFVGVRAPFVNLAIGRGFVEQRGIFGVRRVRRGW